MIYIFNFAYGENSCRSSGLSVGWNSYKNIIFCYDSPSAARFEPWSQSCSGSFTSRALVLVLHGLQFLLFLIRLHKERFSPKRMRRLTQDLIQTSLDLIQLQLWTRSDMVQSWFALGWVSPALDLVQSQFRPGLYLGFDLVLCGSTVACALDTVVGIS